MNEVKKIMVGIDFSENAEKILHYSLYVAKQFQAELTIVYVVERFDKYVGLSIPHTSLDSFEQEMVASAEKKMEFFVEDTIESDIPYTTKILAGKVDEEIVGFADKEGMDMIIVGTHGYRGLEKMLLGSVAKRIVGIAPCPVMTINPYK